MNMMSNGLLWATEAGREIWTVTGEMAPYLLFGFLIAGVLSVVVSPERVERHLGGRGLWPVVKAALFGVPLPLCSCGVVPVAVSLRRHGASKGATVSFLASTPQTGVDSIVVTYGLLGPVVAVARVVVAFASGLLGGALVDLAAPRLDGARPEHDADCECCHHPERGWVVRALRYGFVTLARDVGRGMLLGILVSGLVSSVVPDNYFADKLAPGFASMLVMMLVGIPMYVCSSGSVPIAVALIKAGVTPGAALVFLVTGPATNAATVLTVWRVLGKGATAVYLGSIAVCALGAGLLLDRLGNTPGIVAACHARGEGPGWLGTVLAAILLAVLLPSLLPRRAESEGACCEREEEHR